MLAAAVFVSVIFAASASKCCIPPQWEGQVYFLTSIVHNEKARSTTGRALVAFDAIGKKIGQKVTESIDGKEREYEILLDFNTNTKYIRMNQDCMKIAMKLDPSAIQGCVPDSAAEDDGSVFGIGANSLNMVTYKMDYPGLVYYRAVTADACVPVISLFKGVFDNNYFTQNMNYVNISAGLSDPNELMVPPQYCENAREIQAHYTDGQFNTGLIGKRSFFEFF